MGQTKAPQETNSAKSTAQVAQQQPKQPEKQAVPTRVARMPMSQAASNAGGASNDPGDAHRARSMTHMQRSLGNARAGSMMQPPIQTKLTVNAPGDAHEQEADAVARNVVQNEGRKPIQRMHTQQPIQRRAGQGIQRCAECAQRLQRDPNAQLCPSCEAKLQRRSNSHNTPEVTPEIENKINAKRGSGEPIADHVRAPMEQGMGADFSHVRVHTDSTADHLNRSMDSRAFATGSDIFFKQGEYNPDTSGGRELLAHELTHTVQQGGAPKTHVQREPTPNPPIVSNVTSKVDTIIDRLEGITTTSDSEDIMNEFRGQSAGTIQAMINEIKARGISHDETPNGMIRWLFKDIIEEHRRELRQILIAAGLTQIIAHQLIQYFDKFFDDSTEALQLFMIFKGAGLDNLLLELEREGGKDENASITWIFSRLGGSFGESFIETARANVYRLRQHFFERGGPKAANYAAIWTAQRIFKLLDGMWTGHSDSSSIVNNFESVPAPYLKLVFYQLNLISEQATKEPAGSLMMHKMDKSDYEKLRSIGLDLPVYKDEQTTWQKIGGALDWAKMVLSWTTCGVIGIATGILSVILDVISMIMDGGVAVYHIVMSILYAISGGAVGKDSWLAVKEFFKALGQLISHPILSFEKMWDEAVLEVKTIEGPLADCRTAEYIVRKFVNLVVTIILTVVAGYGAIKGAAAVIKGVAEFAALVREIGLLRALVQTAGRTGKAFTKLVSATGTELSKLANALRTPVQSLIKVGQKLNFIRLALKDEGVFAAMRGKGKSLIADEKKFWDKYKKDWGKRTERHQIKHGELSDNASELTDAYQQEQKPPNAEAVTDGLGKEAETLDGEVDNLEKSMKTGAPTSNGLGFTKNDLQNHVLELEGKIDKLRSHPDAERWMDALEHADELLKKGDLDNSRILLEGLRERVALAEYVAAEEGLVTRYGEGIEDRLIEFDPTEPSGKGTPVHLDATAPPSGDSTGQRLLGHVRDAIAKFEVEGFTPAQRTALLSNPELEAAYRGSRIDEFAKTSAMRDPELQHVLITQNYEFGADFYDSRTGRWYDITTTGAWRNHVRKYGPLGMRLPTAPAP